MSNSSAGVSDSAVFIGPVIGAILIHVVVAALVFSSWTLTSPVSKEFEIPKHIRAEVVTLEKPKEVVTAPPKQVPKPKAEPVKVTPKPIAPVKPKPEPAKVEPKPEPVIKEVPRDTIDLSEPAVVEPVEPIAEVPKEPETTEPEDVLPVDDSFEDLLANLAAEEQAITQQIENITETQAREAEIQAQVQDYANAIRQQIEQKWSRPVELRLMDVRGLEAIVAVELLPTGELQSASILSGSGNTNFDQSVIRAIEKVRRFDVPEDAEVFEKGGFRRLNITFRPEDLIKL